jgi:polar amino acid transport system substrate-binding protein
MVVFGVSSTVNAPRDPGTPATLRIAVYRDFPPFSLMDRGIDVELARRLADRLGRIADITAYSSGESVEEDLRYVLTRGRRAEVLMHVPAETALARRVPQVRLLAPYYRERIILVYDRGRMPDPSALDALATHKVGVALATGSDTYLMAALNGGLQKNVVHFLRPRDMVAALDSGVVDALMGESSELEAALIGAGSRSRYEITGPPPPGPTLAAWDIGLAVRAEDESLAVRLDSAMAGLREEGTMAHLFADRGLTYTPPQTPAVNATTTGPSSAP